VIDLVNDYFHDGPLRDQRAAIVDSVNQLTGYFRGMGFPVIWIRQEFSPDLSDAFLVMRREGLRVTRAGTEGAMLLAELDRASGDLELIKKRYSAFFGTELDSLLTQIQANPIVLAGINTHACIRMTVIDAYQRDLEVIIASDCVRSYDEEHHRVTLEYLDGKIARVLSNAEIEATFLPKDDS
jgi:nicotinamidase-related amidase